MPILVDPDGIVVKREDFDGHYIIMYHPRNDSDAKTETGSEKVDWELWHRVIKPKLLHRIPGNHSFNDVVHLIMKIMYFLLFFLLTDSTVLLVPNN